MQLKTTLRPVSLREKNSSEKIKKQKNTTVLTVIEGFDACGCLSCNLVSFKAEKVAFLSRHRRLVLYFLFFIFLGLFFATRSSSSITNTTSASSDQVFEKMNSVDAEAFYAEYHGHPLPELNAVYEFLRGNGKKIVWLMGGLFILDFFFCVFVSKFVS